MPPLSSRPVPAPHGAPLPAAATDLAELAVVVRNGFPESRHFGILSALDADGAPALELGDPTTAILPRSAAKAFQAIACLRAGADLRDETLAIAAASHPGGDEHVAAARAILSSVGLGEEALQCPAAMPRDEVALARAHRDGAPPRRLWFNCSGKHAAMLAACVVNGWDTATYRDPSHPLQRLVRDTLEEFAGPVSHVAVDGCGAPLFGITVRGLALAFHRLVTADPESDAGRVVSAMRGHPHLVAGPGHDNTELMRLLPGFIVKGGAEGVLAVAAPSGEAVALKVADGADRATTLVALEALAGIGVDVRAAAALRFVPVLGGGDPVGRIVPGAAFPANS